MSNLPYNSKAYLDAKVAMTDNGTVDAGKQMQSPASAGSRGMAKTMQFSKDKTQMQMGNSPIAESMIQIQNILSRIDGICAPMSEDNSNYLYLRGKEIDQGSIMYKMEDYSDGIFELQSAKYADGTELDEKELEELESTQELIDWVMIDFVSESAVEEGAVINSDAQRLANEIMGLLIRNKEYFEKNDSEKAYMIMQYAKNLKKFTKAADRQEESAVQEDEGDKYFDYENSDEYADNVEKYGDVDKTPLTPQERQQFAKWLIDSANDYAATALDGVEEIGDDTSDIEDQYHKFIPKIKEYLKKAHATQNIEDFASDVLGVEEKFGDEDMLDNDEGYRVAKDHAQHAMNYESGLSKLKSKGQDYTVKTIRGVLDLIDDDPHIASAMLVFQQDFEGTPLQKKVSRVQASESTSSDSGELSRLKELSGIKEDTNDDLMQWAKKYSQYKNLEDDNLIEALYDFAFDLGITQFIFEVGELQAAEQKLGKKQEDWEDAEINAAMEMSPISNGLIDDLHRILPGNAELEQKLDSIRGQLEKAGLKEDKYQPMPEGDEFDIAEDEDFEEVLGALGFPEDETDLFDAEYQGRKVPLNKPMRGDVKKFKVYVKDPSSGNVKKVNFGHGGTSAKRPTMRIRKSNPKARKSFRARHNCANPGPKTKARYWSCRKW